MATDILNDTISPTIRKAGWAISALLSLFFTFDGAIKLVPIQAVVDGSRELGLPIEAMPAIGAVLLLCTALYLLPATSVLGAILLTGYLGGAILTHVRVGGPAFSVVFAFLFGVLVWFGLYLRDARIRALIPLRS